MYTTVIDGVEETVENRPWTTEGSYSDEMNLQTAAVQLAKYPGSSHKLYDSLTERKFKFMDEVADIKARRSQAQRAQAKSRPGADYELNEFKGTGGKSRRTRRKCRNARKKSRHARRKSRHARK